MSHAAESLRIAAAVTLVLAYVVLCWIILGAEIRKRRSAALNMTTKRSQWLIAFASQTGTAEDLARQTASTLVQADLSVRVCELSALTPALLSEADRVLFVVSTYGEGDPPDNAAAFASQIMNAVLPLNHLRYGVLALGDRRYVNFCGFGRSLDEWLRRQGACSLFDRVDVDRCDAEKIGAWWRHLSEQAETGLSAEWQAPNYSEWRLADRYLLNNGSAGEPAWHIELEPVDGVALPAWQSGDLAQVVVPSDPHHPREYSIASVPEDGRIHLLVRLRRHASGGAGSASHWLTSTVMPGDVVKLRLRRHPRFRLDSNAHRPLILIGNGTGIAGLRGHLKARLRDGAMLNWLVFGERNAAFDFHYAEDIKAWQAAGFLKRVDMVFSRDQPERHYVQDRLREASDMLISWVEQGAAVYVCGSLKGMASGVHQALVDLLGAETVAMLDETGRYRRDVY